jgi:asparagine synthase (glutamine-hydrolysing)
MCAICGIVNFDGRPVEEAAVVTMRDVMVNRGPDAAGLRVRANAGLGHQRLSIIDLSPLGNQPMFKEDGSLWVVFSGEISNFPELRCPLLDTDLATLSCSIDPRLKVRGGRQKYLLKKLAERYLPLDLIYRPKRGFELPLKHWLRAELRPLLDLFVLDGKLVEEGWFHRGVIERLIHEHGAGGDHTHRLWSLLWLELWWRMFIERTLKPGDSLK